MLDWVICPNIEYLPHPSRFTSKFRDIHPCVDRGSTKSPFHGRCGNNRRARFYNRWEKGVTKNNKKKESVVRLVRVTRQGC